MRILILNLSLIIGLSSAAFGATITKTFEVGAGTAFPSSNRRDFSTPCIRAVHVKVRYSRKGKADSSDDIPLTVELISPDDQDTQNPPEVSEQVTAKTTVQTLNMTGKAALKGCTVPWSVRVKGTDGNPPLAVSGDISITYDDSVQDGIAIENDGELNLNSNNTVEQFLIVPFGLGHGVLEIKGNWYHNLGVLPIKMRFELIDPNGNVVKSAEGYSQYELNPCCSANKLVLTHRITNRILGRWKLRIKNISSGHDAVRIFARGTFKPGCP